MKTKDWEAILTDKAEISQMNRAKNGEMIWALPILYVAAYLMVDMFTVADADMTVIMNDLLKGGFLLAAACMMLAGWLYDHCGNNIFHCITDYRGKDLDALLKKRKLYAALMAAVPAVVFIAGLVMQFSGQNELYIQLIKPRTRRIYIVPALWGFYSMTLRKNFKKINEKINNS